MPSADSGIFDENIVERCDFAMSRCQSDDHWNTLQRRQLEHAAHSHTNTHTHTHTHTQPVVQRSVGKHPHAEAAVRVGRRHLCVRAERTVFSYISFLSLA